MSKRHLRQDPICQNCGTHVEERFCGHCGQENTETRQSFGHLFRHFVEDLTHYDGAFWRTMKYLLFKPAYLTKEFLKGRRASFVPPVRLYIFVSFVTFLLPYMLPEYEEDAEHEESTEQVVNDTIEAARIRDSIALVQINDSIANDTTDHVSYEVGDGLLHIPRKYKTVKQLDSAQALLPESQRLSPVARWMNVRSIGLQKYTRRELGEKFAESFARSFPKTLFIYLPLFAFVLWLFHGKRRWMYFDHAIFTLHFFSFILLVFNLLSIVGTFAGLNGQVLTFLLVIFAIFIYFLMAHRRMYEESRVISFLKSMVIYTINSIIFILLLLVMMAWTLFTLH
jgi:hypothetical protein